MKTHKWTKEDEEILVRDYRNNNESLKYLAQKIGISESSVRSKLGKLGLLKQTTWWTAEELEYLEENYGSVTLEVLMKKLKRSSISIFVKAHRLKVSKTTRSGWFTQSEVARILGVDAGWIKRRIEKGYVLERKKFHKEDQKVVWRISEKSLRNFIRTYPEELTGHNVDFVMIVDILAGVKRLNR